MQILNCDAILAKIGLDIISLKTFFNLLNNSPHAKFGVFKTKVKKKVEGNFLPQV